MGELLGFYIVGIPRLNIYTYTELERPARGSPGNCTCRYAAVSATTLILAS